MLQAKEPITVLFRSKRHCAECRASVRVDKHDLHRPYIYCSTGCRANGWRRVHRLEPIADWYGMNIQRTAAQMLAPAPA